jgi:hypothetical protein
VWTRNFKSSAAAEDVVQEDDVDMTVEGGASGAGAPTDEVETENRQYKDMTNHRFSINWRSG